jgi:hypothetical protein
MARLNAAFAAGTSLRHRKPNHDSIVESPMPEPSSKMNKAGKRRTVVRLRELIDEFRTLTALLPDLRDAFDPDELPLAFILERNAKLMEPSRPRKAFSRPAPISVRRRTTPSRATNRRRRGKRAAEE